MQTGYIICTTPRSGSTLLCTLLESTGQAGHPDSFYHEPHFMREWAEAWGLPDPTAVPSASKDAAYLEAVRIAGRGATAVFGMRLQQDYLAPLTATLAQRYPDAETDSARFERAFGPLRYVYLRRLDKVAQAVSLVKARQSGLWHRNADGSERERIAPPATPHYDRHAIETEIGILTYAERAWHAWFERERIEPISIVYETLARAPDAIVRKLCAELGVGLSGDLPVEPVVARLSDATNADWTMRYRSGSDDSDRR